MDTPKVLILENFLSYTRTVDRLVDSDFYDQARERLKTAETCDSLKKRFQKHLAGAGFVYQPEPLSEPPLPLGPKRFADTGGYFNWVPPSEPHAKPWPNDDFLLAQRVVNLADMLDCPWVEAGRKELEAKRPPLG